jgi:transcriptional regulator with XRE-family HTH domain
MYEMRALQSFGYALEQVSGLVRIRVFRIDLSAVGRFAATSAFITRFVIIYKGPPIMTGADLRTARKKKGLTQSQAATRLRVTQAYLSMLEKGLRPIPSRLTATVLKAYNVSPLALPMKGAEDRVQIDDDDLARELSALGYPGFVRARSKPSWNPTELLLAALIKDNLDTRVAEAIPWLALHYSGLDWDWVVNESKQHDVQNRLGFAVTLARELAEIEGNEAAAQKLCEIESLLERSILAKPQTLCHENMSQAERRWLQHHSSAEARRWNVLSDLTPEHLTHARQKTA